MKFERLPPELQTWFRQLIGQGSSRDAVIAALRTAGYEMGYAQAATAAAFAAVPAPVAPPAVVASAQAPAAGALDGNDENLTLSQRLVTMPNAIDSGDRPVHMLLALTAPRIVLFGNLLAPEECEQMIELARGKLERSSVVNTATGSYDVHPHRTSHGTHFARGENDLVRRIERRIAELVQYPVERGEPIQILHYRPGGEYRPHFDYFDPAQPGNEAVLKQGGQRIATLIMYLNDVEAGGSTVFPEVGIDVLPRRGNAVYFAYCSDSGALDARSLHGGSPVGGGEKWIATKWFRQRDYVGTGA